MLAVSYNYGTICYQFMSKHLNQASFIYFLQCLKRIMLKRMGSSTHKYVLFMDNLTAYKTKNVI